MTGAVGSGAARSGVVPVPPEYAARYRAAGYWRGTTIGDDFSATAATRADTDAIVSEDDRLSYRQLDEQSDRLAAGLLRTGLTAGDVVLFQMGNVCLTAVAFYACAKAGLVPICALPQHRGAEIDQFLRQTAAKAHLVQADYRGYDMLGMQAAAAQRHPGLRVRLAARVPHDLQAQDGGGGGASSSFYALEDLIDRTALDGARAELAGRGSRPEADDIAVLQLSGGTTGVPKIISRTHNDYLYNSRALAEAWVLGPDDVVLRRVVLMHNAGLVTALLATHLAGATAVLSPLGAIERDLKLAQREGVTVAGLGARTVPDVLSCVSRQDIRLPNLRLWIVSGMTVPPAFLRDVERDLGVPCTQLFGMGEGLFLTGRLDASAQLRHETVGTPLSASDEVRILLPGSEEEAGLGEVGELCARGPYTIRGYFNSPDHNAEAFTADGFYRSGDLARARVIDGELCFSIEGRIKDMINRGGEKISAVEVEGHLAEHPDIAAASVVAAPDPVHGEKACVFVVPADPDNPPTLESVCSFLHDRGLAKFKFPERLVHLAALPVNNTEKVDKRRLRDLAAEALRVEIPAQLTTGSHAP